MWCIFVILVLSVTEEDLYPLIARFMAAKPSMDLSDIPLYYSMMHSSSTQVIISKVTGFFSQCGILCGANTQSYSHCVPCSVVRNRCGC